MCASVICPPGKGLIQAMMTCSRNQRKTGWQATGNPSVLEARGMQEPQGLPDEVRSPRPRPKQSYKGMYF